MAMKGVYPPHIFEYPQENQCGTSGAHDMSIASSNGHNISIFLIQCLEISGFP
jgi:hypothetical protein